MEEAEDIPLADKIATACHQKYQSLPKRGKPRTGCEWTHMAAILYTTETSIIPRVIALGTGSKCIGQTKMSVKGDVVNDSHAEIITRRAFLCYLYSELIKVTRDEDSDVLETALDSDTFRCRVKDGIKFHLYISHTPCGDASIFLKNRSEDVDPGDVVVVNPDKSESSTGLGKHKLNENSVEPVKRQRRSSDSNCFDNQSAEISEINLDSKTFNSKCKAKDGPDFSPEINRKNILKTDSTSVEVGVQYSAESCMNNGFRDKLPEDESQVKSDIYRTGAKCVPGGEQDPRGLGARYHCLGALRIKPGRGDRTISMSCSDKLARWNVVGCQGALLTHFLCAPIFITSLTLGRCPFDKTALKRAVCDRVAMVTDLPSGYHVNKLQCSQSSLVFPDGKEAVEERTQNEGHEGCTNVVKMKPSATAMMWYDRENAAVEVSVNGRRQGVTAKNFDKPQARCEICSSELFGKFCHLLSAIPSSKLAATLRDLDENHSYWDYKSAAESYQTACRQLRRVFSPWLSKSRDHLQFTHKKENEILSRLSI